MISKRLLYPIEWQNIYFHHSNYSILDAANVDHELSLSEQKACWQRDFYMFLASLMELVRNFYWEGTQEGDESIIIVPIDNKKPRDLTTSAGLLHSWMYSQLKCSRSLTSFSIQNGASPSFPLSHREDSMGWNWKSSRARSPWSWCEGFLPFWKALCWKGSSFVHRFEHFLVFLQACNSLFIAVRMLRFLGMSCLEFLKCLSKVW